jgi:hypothetical protein
LIFQFESQFGATGLHNGAVDHHVDVIGADMVKKALVVCNNEATGLGCDGVDAF